MAIPFMQHLRGGGGGGGTRANSVCFTKSESKLELFLMHAKWAKFGTIFEWTKKINDAIGVGEEGSFFSKLAQIKQRFIKTCQLRVYLRKLMHSMPSQESARKPRENIEALVKVGRSGQYQGFQTPFFEINLFLDFGYEVPMRRPLFWPVGCFWFIQPFVSSTDFNSKRTFEMLFVHVLFKICLEQ